MLGGFEILFDNHQSDDIHSYMLRLEAVGELQCSYAAVGAPQRHVHASERIDFSNESTEELQSQSPKLTSHLHIFTQHKLALSGIHCKQSAREMIVRSIIDSLKAFCPLSAAHQIHLSTELAAALTPWNCHDGTKWCSTVCYALAVIGDKQRPVGVFSSIAKATQRLLQLPQPFEHSNKEQRRSSVVMLHLIDPIAIDSLNLPQLLSHNYSANVGLHQPMTLDEEYLVCLFVHSLR